MIEISKSPTNPSEVGDWRKLPAGTLLRDTADDLFMVCLDADCDSSDVLALIDKDGITPGFYVRPPLRFAEEGITITITQATQK